ncbi:MBL fold metallo-hydrolase [Candidatus Bathyarchaeota archaeon]|nr:MBL fold metallo-hydrolase [Candidatus Bathyarchaeota archaeon]
MIFEQVKAERGDNFSYFLGDEDTGEVAIVDPSFSGEQLLRLVEKKGWKVRYVIDTHFHGDHTFGNELFSVRFKAQIVAHKLSGLKKDVSVDEDDVITVGKIKLKVIHTPGHSPDGICLLVDGKVLTGDTLFVGECGRTDTPGGSAKDLYHSLFDKLMKLKDSIEVYPGHDYGPRPSSTIGLEKKTNYVLKERTCDEFVEFMKA